MGGNKMNLRIEDWRYDLPRGVAPETHTFEVSLFEDELWELHSIAEDKFGTIDTGGDDDGTAEWLFLELDLTNYTLKDIEDWVLGKM
jgi:hypothetical protein